uniref:C1q domain-containing protein n=1 Tax=Echeneis naucrates TaxID=173247 RepID=A0A665V5H8_ECHNA
MRAGLSLELLLLCLLVQVSYGEDTKLQDFLANNGAVNADTTADQFADQGNTNSDIMDELTMLRDMVVGLKVELRNLETRLKETELQTDEHKLDLALTKSSLDKLEGDHTAVEGRLTAIEKQGEELKKENTEQAAELTLLKGRFDIKENQLEKLRANTTESQVATLIKDNVKVAFYASLTNSGNVGPYNSPKVLRFTKVFSNIGKAYSPTTGFFTAPVKGLYYFRFTVCGSKTKGNLIGLKLYLNGRSILYNVQTAETDYTHFEYFSNAVILEMNADDELHAVLPENGNIFDNANSHTTFSGFLLFTI